MHEEEIEKDLGIRGERVCPRCNKGLVIVEAKGEQIDICDECGGIWFDPRELDIMMGEESPVELLINIKDPIKSEKLKCPECREYMGTKEIYGVVVDECGICNGIWLDAGELEKILAEEGRAEAPYRHEEDELKQYYDKYWNMLRKKYRDLMD